MTSTVKNRHENDPSQGYKRDYPANGERKWLVAKLDCVLPLGKRDSSKEEVGPKNLLFLLIHIDVPTRIKRVSQDQDPWAIERSPDSDLMIGITYDLCVSLDILLCGD